MSRRPFFRVWIYYFWFTLNIRLSIRWATSALPELIDAILGADPPRLTNIKDDKDPNQID